MPMVQSPLCQSPLHTASVYCIVVHYEGHWPLSTRLALIVRLPFCSVRCFSHTCERSTRGLHIQPRTGLYMPAGV